MTTEAVEDVFADIIREKLHARFKDEFVFEPIRVQREWDLDERPFLHAYIVFEGDQKKLDPSWTASLPMMLWPDAEKLGFPGLPIQSFVIKSEWRQLEKRIGS